MKASKWAIVKPSKLCVYLHTTPKCILLLLPFSFLYFLASADPLLLLMSFQLFLLLVSLLTSPLAQLLYVRSLFFWA